MEWPKQGLLIQIFHSLAVGLLGTNIKMPCRMEASHCVPGGTKGYVCFEGVEWNVSMNEFISAMFHHGGNGVGVDLAKEQGHCFPYTGGTVRYFRGFGPNCGTNLLDVFPEQGSDVSIRGSVPPLAQVLNNHWSQDPGHQYQIPAEDAGLDQPMRDQ
eukprot:4909937-Ditylum_brightwellii.AAC.2